MIKWVLLLLALREPGLTKAVSDIYKTVGKGLSNTPKLDSVRFYDNAREEAGIAGKVTRVEGEQVNLDRFYIEGEGEITLFHFGVVQHCEPEVYLWSFEDLANVELALAHLNTGDGSIVPEVEGLNRRCPVRFTAELRDSLFSGAGAVREVFDLTSNDRVPGIDRIPSAFIGASYSFVTIPMALVSSLLGYPQISPGATSPELDNKDDYPLFGRSVPSDNGNAVPVLLYFSGFLNLEHLVIINVNDAYGNAYAEAMKNAAAVHAPYMKIRQIPLDDGQVSIESAIASVKESEYRFIFCLVFTNEVHDALLTEAFEQGVAGNGLHNWMFADSFWTVLEDRSFEKGSPLHMAYRGAGMIEISGGVEGIPAYDNYWSKIQELRNPADFEYLDKVDPYYDPDQESSWLVDNNFLDQSYNGWSPFAYEAAIAFGLAACSAYEENQNFTGAEFYDHFLNVTFKGIGGNVSFLQGGSRDPQGALYSVVNYRQVEQLDEESGNIMVSWEPHATGIFVDGDWKELEDYIFNDGTSNIPVDIAPPDSDGSGANLAVAIAVPVALFILVGVLVFLFYESKRKETDSIWKVDKKELKFSDPPVVVGVGAFGVVLLAEYRGTQVAIKRAIPPKHGKGAENTEDEHMQLNPGMISATGRNSDGMISTRNSDGRLSEGMKSGMISTQRTSPSSGLLGATWGQVGKSQWNKLKQEFVEEMRHLSKLRHPCITTIMGAVTGNDPMLVMEFMEHGSLHDILHNETFALEGELLLPMLRDISSGLRFLHGASPQIIHGDLKSANILVDHKFRAKVADFGLTQKKQIGGTGTPYWMAPELLRFESSNTPATDVYSFGIILYEVYSRRDPYEDEEDAKEVLRQVADKSIKKRPPVPRTMPEKVIALMSDCVDDDPEKRPSFEEIDLRLKRIDAEHCIAGENKNKTSQVSLFDIFPFHIAEALRDGKEVEAEHKECVTIFFSDIVGFTTISSKLHPKKVANMLDRLYREFDGLSNKYDIFKVETIGDAYMAVTNLVKDQSEDHAKRIALFATEAILAANSTLVDLEDPSIGFVDIRVGFHSGPVVADVVGTRNPRYCLFGDTVNTASRMESNSKKNRIHCSSAAAKLLKQQCPEVQLNSRGIITVKGKGKMRTYWVGKSGKVDGDNSASDDLALFEGSNRNLGTVAEASEEFAASSVFTSSMVGSSPLEQFSDEFSLPEDPMEESAYDFMEALEAFGSKELSHDGSGRRRSSTLSSNPSKRRGSSDSFKRRGSSDSARKESTAAPSSIRRPSRRRSSNTNPQKRRSSRIDSEPLKEGPKPLIEVPESPMQRAALQESSNPRFERKSVGNPLPSFVVRSVNALRLSDEVWDDEVSV